MTNWLPHTFIQRFLPFSAVMQRVHWIDQELHWNPETSCITGVTIHRWAVWTLATRGEAERKIKRVFFFSLIIFLTWLRNPASFCSFFSSHVCMGNDNWVITPRKRGRWIDGMERKMMGLRGTYNLMERDWIKERLSFFQFSLWKNYICQKKKKKKKHDFVMVTSDLIKSNHLIYIVNKWIIKTLKVVGESNLTSTLFLEKTLVEVKVVWTLG